MADRERRTSVRRDEAEGFLRRWSRRKAEARSTAAQIDDSSDREGATAPLQQPPEPDKGAGSPVDPEDLPDIESLDANSDFTVFMRPGVPEHLRALALRKLWRSDPIFSKLDGLVEYGEDYTTASWPKEAIKTTYQIGRGFADQLEKLEAAAPPVAPEEQTAAAAAAPQEPSGPALAPGAAAPPLGDAPNPPSKSGPSAPEEAQPASAVTPRIPAAGAAEPEPVARRPRRLPRRG